MGRWFTALFLLGVALVACADTSSVPTPATGGMRGTLRIGSTTEVTGEGIAAVVPVRHGITAPRWVPGEVVVHFAPDRLRSLSHLQAANVTLTRISPLERSERVVFTAPVAEAELLEVIAALRQRDDVLDATPNWLLDAFDTRLEPNDAYYGLQWHYQAANLPNAWAIENGTTTPVVVAILDTGVAPHPDLAGLDGYDFVDDDTDPFDAGGSTGYHGTHVAGTVAATTNNGTGVAGVSWGATLLHVRVLGADGSGRIDTILRGVAWAAGLRATDPSYPPPPATPARVINLSLGGVIGGPCPAMYESVFAEAVAAGVTIVAAAGNANIDAAATFPANCPSVIAVGALGPTGERAPYSNYGSVVDLMAPGGDLSRDVILETDDGPVRSRGGVLSTFVASEGPAYAFFEGTSMAAPHVSGVAALLLSERPDRTTSEIRAALIEGAAALSAAECRRGLASDCGAGALDAAAALGGEPSTLTPPVATTDVPTYIAALACTSAACSSFDSDRSSVMLVPQGVVSTDFSFTDLSVGTYLAVGWQDSNDDGDIDGGEPFGTSAPVEVSAGVITSGVEVVLTPLVPGGTTDAASVASAVTGLRRATLGE